MNFLTQSIIPLLDLKEFIRVPDPPLTSEHVEIVKSWWWLNDSGLRVRTLLSRNHSSCANPLADDYRLAGISLVSRESLRGSEHHHRDRHVHKFRFIQTHVDLHKMKIVLITYLAKTLNLAD